MQTCSNCKHWGQDYEGVCGLIQLGTNNTPATISATSADDQGLAAYFITQGDFSCSQWTDAVDSDEIENRISKAVADPRVQRLCEMHLQCGFFDGGCLTFAVALLFAFGPGRLLRVVRPVRYNGRTQHYGALINGRIYDADGGYENESDWLQRLGNQMVLPGGVEVIVGFVNSDNDIELNLDVALELAAILADTDWQIPPDDERAGTAIDCLLQTYSADLTSMLRELRDWAESHGHDFEEFVRLSQ